MPEKSGFEISAEFTEKQVKIVFITAIENYVFKSFENHEYDFIRKSNLHYDLIRVISRYLHEYSPVLSIPYRGSNIHINSKDIIIIRIMRNELSLLLPGKQLTIRKTLKLFLSDYALDKSNLFIQINRSELVNINKIHSINKNMITLYDGSHLYITKKYMEEFIRKYYTIPKRE
jgi:DNA-binding LytR/AlgR family response regulator